MKLYRKFNFLKSSRLVGNDSGIILITVLFIITVLSVLAIGLGRQSSVELSLTKHTLGKTRAYYAAAGGIYIARQLIAEDEADNESNKFDTLNACGLRVYDDEDAQEYLKALPISDAVEVNFGYYSSDYSDTREFHYAFSDEDRRININALTNNTYKVLMELLLSMDLGLAFEEAQQIAANTADWADEDGDSMDNIGEETDGLTKNRPFDSVAEFALVTGVTPEVYEAVQEYLTVYPKDEPEFRLNFNTASPRVMKALARGVNPNVEQAIIDNLIAAIVEYRKGDDGKLFTEDDEPIQDADLARDLNTAENFLYSTLANYRKYESTFIRVYSQGKDKSSRATANVYAVIDRDQLIIHEWNRE